MSSKGQVVIPEEIRKSLGLQPGATFMVFALGSDVVLKAAHKPDLREFDELAKKARAHAKKAGIRKSDVTRIIKQVRAEKRASR